MNIKNHDWYQKELKGIKSRKRKIKDIEDPILRRKMKADLKREQRGNKRAERNYLKKWIDDQLSEEFSGNKNLIKEYEN